MGEGRAINAEGDHAKLGQNDLVDDVVLHQGHQQCVRGLATPDECCRACRHPRMPQFRLKYNQHSPGIVTPAGLDHTARLCHDKGLKMVKTNSPFMYSNTRLGEELWQVGDVARVGNSSVGWEMGGKLASSEHDSAKQAMQSTCD